MDVWQAGCCVIAMVTGRRPWRALYPDCKNPNKDFFKFQVQKVIINAQRAFENSISVFMNSFGTSDHY